MVPYYQYAHIQKGFLFENLFHNEYAYFVPVKNWETPDTSENHLKSLIKTKNLGRGFLNFSRKFRMKELDTFGFKVPITPVDQEDSLVIDLKVTPVNLMYVPKKYNYRYTKEESTGYGNMEFMLILKNKQKRKIRFSFRKLKFHIVNLDIIKNI